MPNLDQKNGKLKFGDVFREVDNFGQNFQFNLPGG